MKRFELTDLRDEIKQAQGYHARTLLLAYAFLRGLPYRRCEPVTHEYGPGTAEYWRKRFAHDIAMSVPARCQDEATGKAAIEHWLLVPEEPHARDARLKREREARAAEAKRRAAAHAA